MVLNKSIMKRITHITATLFLLAITTLVLAPSCNASGSPKIEPDKHSGVVYLTADQFKSQVFNYSTQKEWKYVGKVPAILDFYADWCGPCRMVSPILEELQKEYQGKIQVFKINTDKETEIAGAFQIQSLPTLVFIPLDGKPQGIMGAQPKANLEKMINEVLKVQK